MTDHTPTTEAPAPLMSHRDAARWLGVSERQLDRIKRAGQIPYLVIGSRSIRYRPAALDEWARSQERRNEPPIGQEGLP